MLARPAAALFAFVLVAYLLTFGGSFQSIDEQVYLRMTGSFVDGQAFAIQPVEYAREFSVARGLDGRMYANRPPGWPVIAAPFYWLGWAVAAHDADPSHIYPAADEPNLFQLFLMLTNVLIGAATAVLLFVTVVQMGYRPWVACVVALLYAFGTMAWTYASKSFFAEPLLTMCGLAAFLCARRSRQHPSRRMILTAAALLGWGLLTKVTVLSLIPWLALYLIWPLAGMPFLWLPALRRLLWFGAGLAPFLIALAAYNHLRFGGVLITGYELEEGSKALTVLDVDAFRTGLQGLLVSSGKGLIWYASPVLLGVVAAHRFLRTHLPEALFLYGSAATVIAGIALWRDWSGGWCWGPRLLLGIVPLLIIPAAALFPPASRPPLWQMAGIGIVAIASFAVQLVGVLPSYLVWYIEVGDYDLVYTDPAHSPILGQWAALADGGVETLWNNWGAFFPGHFGEVAIAYCVLVLALPLTGWLLWRSLRQSTLRQGGGPAEPAVVPSVVTGISLQSSGARRRDVTLLNGRGRG